MQTKGLGQKVIKNCNTIDFIIFLLSLKRLRIQPRRTKSYATMMWLYGYIIIYVCEIRTLSLK